MLGVAVIALVGIAAFLIWHFFLRPPDVPPGIVAVSGRLEGDDSVIAPKTSGRILQVNGREGDHVEAGQVLAVLDDDQVRAREAAARAAVERALARVTLAQRQIAVLNEQLRENQIAVAQALEDAQGRIREAEAQVASAEAQLAQRQAELDIAEYDREAYTRLAKSGAVAERQAREAISTANARQAAVATAVKQVEAARGSLNTARAAAANPDIQTARASAVQRQIAQQEAEIASAQADAAQARAQLAEAQANRADLRVLAPFSGSIITRSAEPGEVVTAGTPLLRLLDLSKVYLRAYVPEGQIGRVRLGQPARVYLDSDPNKPLEAWVSRIDPEAAFTPENTYFRQDRVKQVVGVKLQLKHGFGYAKPGMPADGEILVDGNTWPDRRARK
ncbi:MAG TPA: HlyD family efflux transporter periplasmic adaptor subunit [Bryobacteraceae bacterium]|nr:HlyD family efflux transporter periplasmic adaptor subunit [Bryobacteraceae bacterium]